MDPYVGEIRLFSGSYAPRGWMFCQGQELLIQENSILFSVIGFTYGGDGKTKYKLPDLRGRAPVHQGTGPGLTPRSIASTDGESAVTLQYQQMPAHTHAAQSAGSINDASPVGNVWGPVGSKSPKIYSSKLDTPLNPAVVTPVGGNQGHNNMQPYLGLNFIIALEGVYPQKQH